MEIIRKKWIARVSYEVVPNKGKRTPDIIIKRNKHIIIKKHIIRGTLILTNVP